MTKSDSMSDIDPMHPPLPADANFMTGRDGVIAVDKVGNRILFLDPSTYDTVLTLGGFASRVHEVAVSPDRRTAYVPIYGDGKHGDNPNPGHLIAAFDLQARRHLGESVRRPTSRHMACAGARRVGSTACARTAASSSS